MIDNLFYERKLMKDGYNIIAGTDEVGRGPLVGPVVAAAVVMDWRNPLDGVTDSKKLSEKKRELLAKQIKETAIAYQITFIDPKTIDQINILEASRKAMMESIDHLSVKPDIVISDYMTLKIDNIDNLSLIKGDLKSYSVACASIIAKVARDDYMKDLAKLYPDYHYEKNKGYPTKTHLEAIKQYGVTEHYRKSYKPVRDVLKEMQKDA